MLKCPYFRLFDRAFLTPRESKLLVSGAIRSHNSHVSDTPKHIRLGSADMFLRRRGLHCWYAGVSCTGCSDVTHPRVAALDGDLGLSCENPLG